MVCFMQIITKIKKQKAHLALKNLISFCYPSQFKFEKSMEYPEIEVFPVEDVPDDDFLYYRIHKTKIDFSETDHKRKIKLIAFDPQPQGCTEMSTDWSKYSTPDESRNRARVPSDNGIVSFHVQKVRAEPYPLSVKHDPTLVEHFRNRSHTIIFEVPSRKNDIGIRLELRDICNWELPIE